MATNDMSNEEAAKRLKAQGAGHGLFSSPPPPMSGDSFTAMLLNAPPPDDDLPVLPTTRAPSWFKPMIAVMVPAFLATAAFALYPGPPAAAARERVHTAHELTRRGVYVELDDLDGLEFYGPEGAGKGRAGTISKAAVAAARAKAGLDLGGLSYGATHEPLVTPAQASAAKREASFIDLTRNVRRSCRSAADAFPTSVQVRAHIVVGKGGSASEVKVEGNAPGVAACIEREARAYRFPDEAALSTIEVPFSWRKQ